MNIEDISEYRDLNSIYCSSRLRRKTAATTYDFPEHPPKKEKKWTLGSLFRRKKKDGSETSSEDEADKKGFLNRRKKKCEKRKKPKRTTFDHVVIPCTNGHSKYDDSGILSDPTGGFASYQGRSNTSHRKIENCTDHLRNLSSSDSLVKKTRKARTRVRALDAGGGASSSDDDSQRSASSSHFKSDDNFGKRDGSQSRRSRAARTERYIRRLSRDEEFYFNRDLRTCKSDAEHHRLLMPEVRNDQSPNKSPVTLNIDPISHNVVGVSMIPPSHTSHNNKSLATSAKLPPTNCFSSNKYHSLNSNQCKSNVNYQRSVSYDADIHKSSHSPEITPSVLHVQLPLGKPNLSLVERPLICMGVKQPPPPPPRDPWRLIQRHENGRPVSYCFEKNSHHTDYGVNANYPKTNSFNWHPTYRSISEDHLPLETPHLQPRPASASSDGANRKLKTCLEPSAYQYLTDRHPRSRKPIFIQYSTDHQQAEPQKASEFWKEKDRNESKPPTSPQMFTAQSHTTTKIFLPSVLKADMEVAPDVDSTDLKPFNGSQVDVKDEKFEKVCETRRKSSNLEDALDELEAIYNSLRLGDEDLLERAEQRELSMNKKKFLDAQSESYPIWNGTPRGAISDSGFNYEPFDTLDSPRRKRLLKKNHSVDRKCDDMAYRKLHKERSVTDPKEILSSMSYLLTSPIHGTPNELEPAKHAKEPDITLDDLVYRSIKHSNNTLKVTDPQPPFGIPIGPILPAANSDYLHAHPEKSNLKNKKNPDVIKDDLAFRNLRKDSNKEPVLPPLLQEDISNNNVLEPFKKKRAVRSLSANIYNLMNDHRVAPESKQISDSNANLYDKSNLSNIADAMQIAREILKEKENKIKNTRRDFLSDTEAKYRSIVNEQRNNFLNGMKSGDDIRVSNREIVLKTGKNNVQSKPPKASTPDKIESKSSSLEDVFAAFAIEAHETSERITKELKKMENDVESFNGDTLDSQSESRRDSQELLATTKTESTPVEEVEQFHNERRESIANVVTTRNAEDLDIAPVVLHSDSEHDYVNICSDDETDKAIPLIDEFSDVCVSPFDEKKANKFSELHQIEHVNEDVVAKNNDGENRFKHRLPRYRTSLSCGSAAYGAATMSDNQESRAERIARYKEQRRKQLAEEYGSNCEHRQTSSRKSSKDQSVVGGSDGFRTTRASRLRTAAAGGQDATKEKTPTSSVPSGHDKRKEKDKSSKRKSNLNRSQDSEEVPCNDLSDETKSRRRNRRFFPPDVLQQSSNCSSNEEKTKSDTSHTAYISPSSSPITATISTRSSPRKSELSIHMENARKGVTIAHSEMGKCRTSPRRVASNAKEKSKLNSSDTEQNTELGQSNKENIKRKNDDQLKISPNKKVPTPTINDDKSGRLRNANISKRVDDLTALTRETLSRVEKLANKNRNIEKKFTENVPPPSDHVKSKGKIKPDTRPLVVINESKNQPSILKKKSFEECTNDFPNFSIGVPVSILKRKVFQDESKLGHVTSTHTPPVTFSPSVVEPATNNKRQGILKKRRSLDESQVLRHRSCSPDVANDKSDSRSILKNQRRSSLEEIVRTRSPDSHIHGILKRKTSKVEDDPENSLNSPHGILKRRSGASSAGSTTTTQHVSIATAVILAAAGGAEIVLESNDHVRPILKKKSFEEQPHADNPCGETLKPILKKKSSTDTDEAEEKPKKPILKQSRNTTDQTANDSGSECDVRPILKQGCSVEESPRPKLSFCAEEDSRLENSLASDLRRIRNRRLDAAVRADFDDDDDPIDVENGRNRKARPASVLELVMNFEKTTTSSTGAIPKKSSLKRTSDRSRTQPVTFNEIEASLSLVQNPQLEDFTRASASVRTIESGNNAQSLFDLTSSSENDGRLNNLFSTSITNTSVDSGVGKMSSDSAFQSLGDGLELEDERPPVFVKTSSPCKFDSSKLQMKAIAEEAKNLRLKGSTGMQKYRNRQSTSTNERSNSQRYSTQPVTLDEVQEATKLNKTDSDRDESDPSKLSLSERIKMFNTKLGDVDLRKRDVSKRRHARFQTQPVTSEEVETARSVSPNTNCFARNALDEAVTTYAERKSILKSYGRSSSPPPRSVLKKHSPRREDRDAIAPRPILKPESNDCAYNDEGISSNDSSSDSDAGRTKFVSVSDKENVSEMIACIKDNISARLAKISLEKSRENRNSCSDTHTTSDESSGGREIQSIIGREAAAARRRMREKSSKDTIVKSRSQAIVNDDDQYQLAGIRRSMTQGAMHRSIGELQAKLQQSGDSDWRKRIPKLNNANEELNLLNVKNIYNEELSEKTSILAAKKDELDAASQQWKSRIEKPDAVNFSVAGRMQHNEHASITINIPTPDKTKRTPKAKRFKGKESDDRKTESMPVSPDCKGNPGFKRSISVPGNNTTDESSGSENSLRSSGRRVKVLKPDDDTFTSFFKNTEERKTEALDLSVNDFDVVTRGSQKLLVHKRTVQVQKRRIASKNPVKALASRSDIVDEYTEVLTGVAERELRRLNVEKLAKSSSFAMEALAGLASKEDFSSVALKKATTPNSSYLPYKNLMLIHIKGRRHVQARLVEPSPKSINQGDSYVLITPTAIYNYVGPFANIIEQSRANDIVNHIQQTGDMGCQTDKIITINSKRSNTKDAETFWKLLGHVKREIDPVEAGHPDEDEVYESSIIGTNMVYGLENDELVPLEEYWGKIPKIQMLNPSKIYVFDFGSEMYVWSGKNAAPDQKKLTLKLAKELWAEGYNYTECGVSPVGIAEMLGAREKAGDVLLSDARAEWALFAKITQHRETILFREKFLDWPDYSRVIKVKTDVNEKSDSSIELIPCDVGKMINSAFTEPDFEVDGSRLGRGNYYFDKESNRHYEISTLSVTCWRILENTYENVANVSLGHLYDADTYIIRWEFRVTNTGRELSGKPSKYNQTGRDRCLYFCWLGNNASVNEKGAAALLTVELDSENARQIRVTQGSEPTAFVRLFDGRMVVHSGKCDPSTTKKHRLYVVRGEMENETVLIEVPCSMRSLRSRGSFIFINTENGIISCWHGCKSLSRTRYVAKKLADGVYDSISVHFGAFEAVKVEEIKECQESDEFLEALGEKRQLYSSLILSLQKYEDTPRLFHFSSIFGSFSANELLCLHRSTYTTPFPFLQSDLYSANQPALFLFDNGHELWLWQGWWPERSDDLDLSDQTGSGAIRWQEERKVAMETTLNYWKHKHGECKSVPAYLVWAGLEPLSFTNLFSVWNDRDDITELVIKDGKKAGEIVTVEKELAQLTRTTYPLEQLLQRPLPDGVDPTHLENYLSAEEFTELLSMTKSEFQKLPSWKQTTIKKEKGLF